MGQSLAVITSNGYWKRIRLLYVICGPFGLLALRNAVRYWDDGSGKIMLGIAVFMLGAPMVFVFARRWWVQFFDERGVTLRNGRHFSWSKFKGVEVRTAGRYRQHNNFELHFEDGVANVYDLMAANGDEVRTVMAELARGENRFTRPSSD